MVVEPPFYLKVRQQDSIIKEIGLDGKPVHWPERCNIIRLDGDRVGSI